MKIIVPALALLACLSPAQAGETEREAQAIPFLIQQRNSALDASALCSGDLSVLKKENIDLKAELEKLKKEKGATTPRE